MSTIYALLVGINNYPVKPLAGCINDVTAVAAYLNHHCQNTGQQLKLKRLTEKDEEQPTRANVIEAFRHFSAAKKGDCCLFYYSGHGSFAPAPKEFWAETDGMMESLVCIDSRSEGGRDLMDKELGYLLWKTFRSKPDVQVVVITDCCHSGTITKEMMAVEETVTERMMTGSNVLTGIQSFYGFNEQVDGENGYEVSADGKRVSVKQTGHIHLAACRDNQTAKELIIDGKRRGAFTHSLLKTLYATGGRVPIRELVNKAAIAVNQLVFEQAPGVSFNGGLPQQLGNQYLLMDAGRAQKPKLLVYYDNEAGWCIKAGPAQGVHAGDTVLIKNMKKATVSQSIAADASQIAWPEPAADTNLTYYATILPQAKWALKLSFAPDVPVTIKSLLFQAAKSDATRLLTITDSPGQLVIRYGNDGLFITQPGSGWPLFKPQPVENAYEANAFLNKAARLSRWRHVQELENAATGFGPEHYSLQLYKNGDAGNYDPETFEPIPIESINEFVYGSKGEKWFNPAFRLKFTNKSSATLWMGCVYLGFDYNIDGSFMPPVQVAPGKDAWITFIDRGLPNDVIKLKVDKHYRDLGYTQITEYLKLFIGTSPVDTSNLTQPGLELAALEKLESAKSVNRGPGGDDDDDLPTSDWTTETIGLRIVRPMDAASILPQKSTTIQGITIQPHPAFSAKVALSSSNSGTRSAAAVPPPHLAHKNGGMAPFHLGTSTRSDAVLDVLELLEVENRDAVSGDAPLIISPVAANRAADGDEVLPIGYDAENDLYFPVGYTDEQGNIVIHVLPEETQTDPAITYKSLGGSIKIYFQKILNKVLGLPYKYPRLAIATVNDQLEVSYNDDLDTVKGAVAKAGNILLFLHGIIGDTQTIVPCIKTSLEHGSTLEKGFDLVLTFDYENLNTKIEENAALLKSKLAEVGLTTGHDKKLTIAAHSMGGLVSRWFIEKLNGHEVVQQLVMYGTPNGGSHWSDVRDLAETMLTYALNGAAFLKPWMFVLSGLGKLANGLQVTLKQMDPETGIYTLLNDGTDPQIPYIIIAGNTKDIMVKYEENSNLVQKLLKRIRGRGVYDTLDVLLFKQPNDIAVTVNSIGKLPGSENWKYQPIVRPAASDHLNYFTFSPLLMLMQLQNLYQAEPAPREG